MSQHDEVLRRIARFRSAPSVPARKKGNPILVSAVLIFGLVAVLLWAVAWNLGW